VAQRTIVRGCSVDHVTIEKIAMALGTARVLETDEVRVLGCGCSYEKSEAAHASQYPEPENRSRFSTDTRPAVPDRGTSHHDGANSMHHAPFSQGRITSPVPEVVRTNLVVPPPDRRAPASHGCHLPTGPRRSSRSYNHLSYVKVVNTAPVLRSTIQTSLASPGLVLDDQYRDVCTKEAHGLPS